MSKNIKRENPRIEKNLKLYNQSAKHRQLLMKSRHSVIATIRKAFPALSSDEVLEIISAGEIRAYPKGKKLTTEGAYETTFYILLEGEVEVTKKFDENEERILKHLFAGDFFGEMAIIQDAPRAATITAITNVEVLEMEREAFVQLLHTNSQLSLAMVREVSRRLRENDEIAIADLRKKSGGIERSLSEALRTGSGAQSVFDDHSP